MAAGVSDERIPIPEDWRDGTILPDGMRDTLLGLFFERRRQFGLVLHVGRFFGSLDGPPEARPASALLFAMVSSTCLSSSRTKQGREESKLNSTRLPFSLFSSTLVLAGSRRIFRSEH